MAKLILSMDGLVLKEIPITKERTTIGRKAHNDIQIDNLAVSGEHAVIVTILNDSFMEDLGSTNGTLVNGNPVKKHFLQNNDVIELGKYKLKFQQEQAAQPAAAAADFEKTMVLRPSAMKAAAAAAGAAGAGGAAAARQAAVQQAAAGAAAAGIADKDNKGAQIAAAAAAAKPAAAPAKPAATPAAAAASAAAPAAAPAAKPGGQPLGAIQLLSGGNAGKELELSKPLTTLGKPGVQVAVLTRRPQGYFITHVEGAQRPTVNGQAIGAAPHPLKDHDLVEIAGIKMEFFHKN